MMDDDASSEWQQLTGEGSQFISAAELPSSGAEMGGAEASSGAEQLGGTQSQQEMLSESQQQLHSHFSENDVFCGGPVATHTLLVCSCLWLFVLSLVVHQHFLLLCSSRTSCLTQTYHCSNVRCDICIQVLHTRADLGGSQILHGALDEAGLRSGTIPYSCNVAHFFCSSCPLSLWRIFIYVCRLLHRAAAAASISRKRGARRVTLF